MSVLGWFLAVAGLVGLVFGLLQMLKKKKMEAAPFRRPSEIAQLGPGAADPKGMVSTEGQVQPGPQPLVAPMSGEPCLAYEIVVERKWEKHVTTERGTEKKTGSERIHSEQRGTLFQISDGAGSVMVDSNGTIDADMDKSHASDVNVGLIMPGTLAFGRFQMNTPLITDTSARTVGFHATEKIVRPSHQVYALGHLAPGQYGPTLSTPRGIGTGKLLLSAKGRANLLGKTQRNMILGYALGGAFAIGGTLLGIFGPAPTPSASCPSIITDANLAGSRLACDDKIYQRDGKDFTLNVSEKGTYRITVKQPKVKNPIDSALTVKDLMGKQVAYNDGGSPGQDAKIEQVFEPGLYKVNVADFGKSKVEGGYSFKLLVEKIVAPAAVAGNDDKPGTATLTNANIDAKGASGKAAQPAAAANKPAATADKKAADAKDAKPAATTTAAAASASAQKPPASASSAKPATSASPAKK